MQKQLIINADGFGFTPGVNRGILEAIEHGVVTSTSCVPNFPAIEEVPILASRFPHVSIGIHFNLSVGRPVAPPGEVPSLVDGEGNFWRHQFVPRLMKGLIDRRDMLLELEAQARTLLDRGIKLTHWDGHQNKHLYPPYFSAAAEIATKFGIERIRSHRRYLHLMSHSWRPVLLARYYGTHPTRIATHGGGRIMTWYARRRGFRSADRLVTPGYADGGAKFLLGSWLDIAAKLPPGSNEIYCHPGFPDALLRAHAAYVDEREAEVAVLTSQELKTALQKNGIECVSFHHI